MNKKEKEYKTSCFAYVEKNGYCKCSALIGLDCHNCKFYRTKAYYDKYVKPLQNRSGGV
ncbi:MAG: hypothetical protein HFJ29_01420 [Clostridia bacterium]|nr:hypothetical protein [Clostridia bacterium]